MISGNLIIESLPILLHGLCVSLQIALLSSCFGFFIGLCIAILQLQRIYFLRIFLTIYVTVIRGTPMLIQILFAYCLLPQLGISINEFWTAVIAISLNSGAYISQTIRSGIQAIAKGQWEAAAVLGIKKSDCLRYIILPQALTIMLPSLGNELITPIKDSALASVIGVSELTKGGSRIISRTYNPITIYITIALLYLAMTWAISFLIHQLEKRTRVYVDN